MRFKEIIAVTKLEGKAPKEAVFELSPERTISIHGAAHGSWMAGTSKCKVIRIGKGK